MFVVENFMEDHTCLRGLKLPNSGKSGSEALRVSMRADKHRKQVKLILSCLGDDFQEFLWSV